MIVKDIPLNMIFHEMTFIALKEMANSRKIAWCFSGFHLKVACY